MPCKITRLTRAGDRYRDAFLEKSVRVARAERTGTTDGWTGGRLIPAAATASSVPSSGQLPSSLPQASCCLHPTKQEPDAESGFCTTGVLVLPASKLFSLPPRTISYNEQIRRFEERLDARKNMQSFTKTDFKMVWAFFFSFFFFFLSFFLGGGGGGGILNTEKNQSFTKTDFKMVWGVGAGDGGFGWGIIGCWKEPVFRKNRLQNGLGFGGKILGVGKSQSFTRTDFKIV